MKRICIVHGVGYHTKDGANALDKFADRLHRATGAECIVHRWNHPGVAPDPIRKFWGPLNELRDWVHEILMDFTHVTTNIDSAIAALPAADMYVAHSAGSVITGIANQAPQVIFGSPVQLLLNAQVGAKNKYPVLNILNHHDPIAAPVTWAENKKIVLKARWKTLVNPIAAHTCYFESKKIVKLSADWFAKTVGDT